MEFKISEPIVNFHKSVDTGNWDKLFEKTGDKNEFTKFNVTQFKIALKRICYLWNKDIKSRNFVKHLIANFFPLNSFNKVMNFGNDVISANKNICALTDTKLASIRQITEARASLVLLNAGIEYADTEEKKGQAINKYNQKLNTFPEEIINGKFAYGSETSDKFMSIEAMYALTIFVQNFILIDNEIKFTVNKRKIKLANKGIPKKQRLNNKQINEITRANTFGMSSHISKDTFNKLKDLKEEINRKSKIDNKSDNIKYIDKYNNKPYKSK